MVRFLNFLNFFLHFIAFFLLLHVFCEKKQNTRARLFSLARRETTKIGPRDAHRWKRCASELFLARNHPRVGRVARTLPVVQRDLRKDAFRVTDSKKGVPKRRKMRSTSALKIKQTCLDVVKENPPKKPSRDPRRLASNSRLAVSLGTLLISIKLCIRFIERVGLRCAKFSKSLVRSFDL